MAKRTAKENKQDAIDNGNGHGPTVAAEQLSYLPPPAYAMAATIARLIGLSAFQKILTLQLEDPTSFRTLAQFIRGLDDPSAVKH